MKSKNTSTILLVLILCIGFSLLLYPEFSNYWNSFHQSRAIANYANTVSEVPEETYAKIIKDAEEYNKRLSKRENRWKMTDQEHDEYLAQLNISGSGIIGYIEIPQIRCSLPIYHGTDENVLQIAIGHIEGSSLPIGGKGTHTVLSGHRGLPSAKLFTDLDQLVEGDIFMIRILNETRTYEVDQIHIVEPDDISFLDIEKDKDLCTLVTCTPYGINTHRLLVRGHRVENRDENTIMITAEAFQMEPNIVAIFLAIPMLFVLLIWLLVHYRRKR